MQSERIEKKREARGEEPGTQAPSFSAGSGPAHENILLFSGLALLIVSASMVITALVG
ncbi:hypothetical protein ACVNHC_01015 [Pannonibacter sp. Q-1]|uniref:hypothetical protein n=1 Tax=Pannonibacter TaxID=227873 RepID=UPI000B29A923|nr:MULTISPECIES: hypothetical protein [Pannonibacter]